MSDQQHELLDSFVRWSRGANLQGDQERATKRLNGALQGAKTATPQHVEAMLQVCFGKQGADKTSLDQVIAWFTTADKDFVPSDNANELLALSGATLATMLRSSSPARASSALAITLASFGSKRKHKLEFDLPGMAEEVLRDLAINTRRRAAPPSLKAAPDLKKPLETLTTEMQQQAYPTGAIAAANTLSKGVTAGFKAISDTLADHLQYVHRQIAIQDEELQMLWWLLNGWSQGRSMPFTEIPEKSRLIVFAKELADLTDTLPGPIAVDALLVRAGVASDRDVTIPAALNACDGEWLRTVTPSPGLSPLTRPLHLAIARKVETGDETAWVAGWSAATGIAKDAKFAPSLLARLFYREFLLQRPQA